MGIGHILSHLLQKLLNLIMPGLLREQLHNMLEQWLPIPDLCLLTLLYLFQSMERKHMSEGSLEGISPYRIPSEHTVNIGGIDYHSEITETDRVSTFMGLDDYDTLFAARHGRGALDLVPKVAETQGIATPNIISPMVDPELIDSVEKSLPIHDDANLHHREQT